MTIPIEVTAHAVQKRHEQLLDFSLRSWNQITGWLVLANATAMVLVLQAVLDAKLSRAAGQPIAVAFALGLLLAFIAAAIGSLISQKVATRLGEVLEAYYKYAPFAYQIEKLNNENCVIPQD